MKENSRRFHRALDLAAHALAHSNIDVLRAVIATLDPGTWLDRAAHTQLPGRREALVSVARALERLDIWAAAQSMFRRISADHLALRVAWPDAPHMATREILLHALRLALIHRIWLLSTEISDFSPRHGVTRPVLEAAILRLDIEASLQLLAEIFPAAPDPAADCDYGEPAAPRVDRGVRARTSGDFLTDAPAVRDGAGDRDSDHARCGCVRVGRSRLCGRARAPNAVSQSANPGAFPATVVRYINRSISRVIEQARGMQHRAVVPHHQIALAPPMA